MKLVRGEIASLFLLLTILPAAAQVPETYRGLLTSHVRSSKLSLPEHLKDYVSDGRLSLSLRDAVVLALGNKSSVRIQETQVEAAKFSLLGAHKPFDPVVQGSFILSRNSSSGYSQLQGVGTSNNVTLNALTQTGQISYLETFPTGTSIVSYISTSRNSSNSSFYYFNPYYNSTLNVQVTQPLLRSAGRFANTAPLMIARRSLQQSRATFESQVSDAILETVTQYWAVVQASGSLKVERKSLDLAEASYRRDKRALELGALPPLDIYRSQSEMAARHLQSIQSEYSLKRAAEALRLTIGADQDPQYAAIDLELTERPEPVGDLESLGLEETLKQALISRPEIQAVNDALGNDEDSVRLAHNNLKPDLSLTGFYQSSGIGGNQYDLTNRQLISPGGLGSSFSQLFGFRYPGYGGGLSLNLPLKNRGAQAVLGNALVSRRRDLYSSQQVHEGIVREVKDAVHQLEEAKLTLAAGKTSFDLAQKSLAAEQRKYELGTETNFFVLDSQTKLVQAELGLLQTQISYQIARASVDHATGALLKPFNIQTTDLSK